MGLTLYLIPNIFQWKHWNLHQTFKLQFWNATFSSVTLGVRWHLFTLLCQYVSEMQLFVLEKTKNIPDHIHNSLGHPQSVLVSCWSICICLVVYFLKGCFLNLNVFPLRCVSTVIHELLYWESLPRQVLWCWALKNLACSSFPLLSHCELCHQH